MKKIIFDYTLEELSELLPQKFRAKQLYNWIYTKYETDFAQMKNLGKDLIKDLEEGFTCRPLTIQTIQKSKDGTKKYLFALRDNHTVEAVLLPMKKALKNEKGTQIKAPKYTVCISCQVGCRMGCAFCFTTKEGFKRNLSAGEIVAQIVAIKKDNQIPHNHGVNIVYMGMGEPLDNLQNVAKAVQIFAHKDALAISPRRQTISTSGLASQIQKLGEMDLGVLLAISLHAVDDETRSQIMPINKAYNIADVLHVVRNFPIDARKRVMFEYLMLGGLNDDVSSAKKLIKLLHGIKSKVNLILFNPHEGSPFERPSEADAAKFQDYLSKHGVLCTIRQSKGIDIDAACGQLREKEKQ